MKPGSVVVEVAGPAEGAGDKLDENFYASVLDQLERWLATHTPSPCLRRVLLRASQTAFAGWVSGEGE